MTVKADAGARSRGASVAIVLAVALVSARRAHAHPEFSTMGTNRYVTAAVFDDRVDVTDAWLEGALTALETRRGLDTNRDGHIEPAERQAGEEALRRGGPVVTLELDGRSASGPVAVSIDLGDDPRVGPTPVVVERRMRLDWHREARLRLRVEVEPPRVLETELGVVLGPGLALTDSRDRVRFDGPRRSALEDRAATFVVVETARAERGKTIQLVATVTVVALALGAGARALRRRRR